MYNAAKVISDDFDLLCKDIYTITDTQSFPQHLPNLPPLQDTEEDVSWMLNLYSQACQFRKQQTML